MFCDHALSKTMISFLKQWNGNTNCKTTPIYNVNWTLSLPLLLITCRTCVSIRIFTLQAHLNITLLSSSNKQIQIKKQQQQQQKNKYSSTRVQLPMQAIGVGIEARALKTLNMKLFYISKDQVQYSFEYSIRCSKVLFKKNLEKRVGQLEKGDTNQTNLQMHVCMYVGVCVWAKRRKMFSNEMRHDE